MPHVTFIHGISNKPAAKALHRLWLDALARDDGPDLGTEGITSEMVYWADVLYEKPQKLMAEHESNDSVIAKEDARIEMGWRDALDPSERAWTEALGKKLQLDKADPVEGADYVPPDEMETMEEARLERIPLPGWLKKRLMESLLRDVHHYLFNVTYSPRPGVAYVVQDEIRGRMVRALEAGAAKEGPHVVVSHSMGTVIAYDCLKRVLTCPSVDALFTIGSPLGLDEVQDQLQPEWTREDGYPAKLRGGWTNVYDRLDPVAGFDARIANDYRQSGAEVVNDVNEQNYGRWRHNISKYLGGSKLRSALEAALGL